MNELNLSWSEHELEQLTPEEKNELHALLLSRDSAVDAREASEDLAVFARGAWQVLEPTTDLKWNWHLDLICEYLSLVRQNKIQRLIVNVPPQTMKSRLVTVMFPCWCWTKNPSRRYMASSYSERLSTDHSIERRSLLTSEWYQKLWPNKVQLRADLNRTTEFKNTAGGRMLATSTGGTATGKGVHGIINDDPQNPEQAESEADRKSANDFHDGTLSTRLSDRETGWFIIVMQRLHVDDLTAHVQAKLPGMWTTISLPMIAEKDEEWVFPISRRIVTRKQGELLWSVRFTEQSVKEISTELGPYRSAGQLQQRPTPPGGVIIQRHWFKYWNQGNMPPKFDEVLLSFDMNFGDTKSKTPSFVVGQAWGRTGSRKYLLREIRGLWSFAQTIPQVLGLVGAFPEAGYKLIEKKANGAAVLSSLEEVVSGLFAIEPEGSKEARMYAASPDYAAGNVFVPDPAMEDYKWSLQHIEEVCHFPQEPNDRGDAASQAINFFRKNQSGFLNWLKIDSAKREVEKQQKPKVVAFEVRR
jgi:predicted phage terminase large subunit-like protein